MNKIIIVRIKKKIVSALFCNDEIVKFDICSENESLLGNIYVGKVKNVIKNINSAFVELKDGKMAYLAINEKSVPIFVNNKKNNKIVAGDEIIVQVSRDNMKTKSPVVTSDFEIVGKYIILTYNKNKIGISNKIRDINERNRLKEILKPYENEKYGFIARTSAENVPRDIIENEINNLKNIIENIFNFGIHRTCFSILYKAPSSYITDIRDRKFLEDDKVITDDKEIYENISNYMKNFQSEDLDKLKFYSDSTISLVKLYSIETKLEKALNKKVWLKSGGYIVIEPTEALIAIDVNTGKAINGKKDIQDTFFKINMEAANEIVKQIKLRNLSGIIIIDFINMKSLEYRDMLMENLKELVKMDSVKTVVIDMTALNLVEITRKKVKKPLYEQLEEQN